MARDIERTAPTVDEAVDDALDWLDATIDEVDVEVLQEPAEGEPAVVRVRVRGGGGDAAGDDGEETAGDAETDGEVGAQRRDPRPGPTELGDLEDQADAVADFVDELLVRMDIDAIAEPNPQHGHMYVDIVDGPEEDLALLIGRHGQTLEAIQELARMAVGRRLDQRIRVIIDVEDYRKRREARLEEDAREAAERVASEGGEYEFDSMNAYERKLIHDAVAGVAGVETESRGEEPARYVVIRPA